jgi:hypothetical protein
MVVVVELMVMICGCCGLDLDLTGMHFYALQQTGLHPEENGHISAV